MKLLQARRERRLLDPAGRDVFPSQNKDGHMSQPLQPPQIMFIPVKGVANLHRQRWLVEQERPDRLAATDLRAERFQLAEGLAAALLDQFVQGGRRAASERRSLLASGQLLEQLAR